MKMISFREYIQGMSIRQISILMCVFTFFAPAILWSNPVRHDGILVNVEPILIALTWTYSASYPFLIDGFQFLNPELLLPNFMFTGPPILYAIFVVRYCQGKHTSNEVWIVAFLSVAFPVFLGLTPMVSYFLSYGVFTYAGIIPIQLILGYLIVKYKGSLLDGTLWSDKHDSSKPIVAWG